jgi:hypothetical protein
MRLHQRGNRAGARAEDREQELHAGGGEHGPDDLRTHESPRRASQSISQPAQAWNAPVGRGARRCAQQSALTYFSQLLGSSSVLAGGRRLLASACAASATRRGKRQRAARQHLPDRYAAMAAAESARRSAMDATHTHECGGGARTGAELLLQAHRRCRVAGPLTATPRILEWDAAGCSARVLLHGGILHGVQFVSPTVYRQLCVVPEGKLTDGVREKRRCIVY